MAEVAIYRRASVIRRHSRCVDKLIGYRVLNCINRTSACYRVCVVLPRSIFAPVDLLVVNINSTTNNITSSVRRSKASVVVAVPCITSAVIAIASGCIANSVSIVYLLRISPSAKEVSNCTAANILIVPFT